MRLILPSNSNKSIENFFEGSIYGGQTETELEALGYKDMEYVDTLYDFNRKILAHVFKKNDMIGAYDVHGELYIDFQYKSMTGITQYLLSYSNMSNFFSFKKDNGLSDVYDKYDLILEDVIGSPRLLKDSYADKRRYLIMETQTCYRIYDTITKDFLVPRQRNEVTAIHSKYEEIMYRDKYDKDKIEIYSFDNNEYRAFKDKDIAEISFTEIKDFYITKSKTGEQGIVYYEKGNFYTVAEDIYVEIYKVFPDMFVTKITNSAFHILLTKRTGNKWDIEDDYIIDDAKDIQFYGNDAIITVASNNKKLLLSHYILNKYSRPYECDEILYEDNNVFKCYQYSGTQEEITYICCGQAVNYQNSIHNSKYLWRQEKSELRIFSPDGTEIFEKINQNFMEINDKPKGLMTMELQGTNDVIVSNNLFYQSNVTNVFLLITGKEYICNKFQFVWHNLIQIDNAIIDIRGKYYTPDAKILQTFNDYLIVGYKKSIYICDRNFDYTKLEFATCETEELYKYSIVSNRDKAVYVSNDGMDTFTYFKDIQFRSVYTSQSTNDYIIGARRVSKKSIFWDTVTGIAHSDYDVLT